MCSEHKDKTGECNKYKYCYGDGDVYNTVVMVHCNCMRDRYSQGVSTANVRSYVHFTVCITIRINTLQNAGVNYFHFGEKLLELVDIITVTSPGIVTQRHNGEMWQDGELPHWEVGQEVVVEEKSLKYETIEQIFQIK